MLSIVETVRKKGFTVGVVGGSDLSKIEEQLGKDVFQNFDFVFPENGTVAYKKGEKISEINFKEWLGVQNLTKLNSYVLKYLGSLDIPIKTGTFIELRKGMMNICPIGRNCTQSEREEFYRFDSSAHIRERMIDDLQKTFPEFGLKYAIGGQISFDVFPVGWDKTYCLKHLSSYKHIYFFGDKTQEGGNDYEISVHPSVKGHTVTCPEDTAQLLSLLFLSH